MLIASASTKVKLHEFPDQTVVYNYQPGCRVDGPIRSISWNKEGSLLALVPFSGLTDIITVKKQIKYLNTLEDVDETTCASFQKNSKKLIALGTKSGQVLIYDVTARNTKKRFPRTTSIITHVDFTARDTHCVAACKNGEVLLYSNSSNTLSCTFRVPKSNSVSCLKTNPKKRNLILGGSSEGVVVIWDGNTNKHKFYKEAHNAPITAVVFSPINSDLIFTAGSDRLFNFFDVMENKCITSVSVENSMTAADISADGIYLVMGSQNGKVYIYDTRQIQEPVHSFQAHNSTVKHIAFQNASEIDLSSMSSNCSLTTENVTPMKSNTDLRSRCSDSFSMFVQVSPRDALEGSKRNAGETMDAGDSFIAALGLDKNNTYDSFKLERSENLANVNTRRDIEYIPVGEGAFTPLGTSKSIRPLDKRQEEKFLEKCDVKMENAATSTPNLLTSAFPYSQTFTSADLKVVATEAVKEGLKNGLEEIKEDIKYQATCTSYQMRRMFLDMHMAMVKEFIKVENNCNVLRDEIISERLPNSDSSYLLEENEKLKKRIENLEQQIAMMNITQNETSNR